MSKFTRQQRAAIISRARFTVQDHIESRQRASRQVPLATERRDRLVGMVYKTRVNERRPRAQDSDPGIPRAIAAERQRNHEILAHVIAEIRDEMSDEIRRAVRPLAADIADMRATIAEQRLERANERSREIIDLPPLPLRGRELN